MLKRSIKTEKLGEIDKRRDNGQYKTQTTPLTNAFPAVPFVYF